MQRVRDVGVDTAGRVSCTREISLSHGTERDAKLHLETNFHKSTCRKTVKSTFKYVSLLSTSCNDMNCGKMY